MNSSESTRNPVQHAPTSLIRLFVYIIYPLAVIGQVVVIVSKFKEGVTVPDLFNLPNWVLILCSMVTIGVMTYPMFLGREELRTRNKRLNI